jgi:hypothetical protein
MISDPVPQTAAGVDGTYGINGVYRVSTGWRSAGIRKTRSG